jgi:phosphoesterase RecJ-like protein
MIDEREKGTIARLVRKSETFMICGHVRPDADSIGAQLALYRALRQMGRRAEMWMDYKVPANYLFLPGSGDFHSPALMEGRFDVIFALDTPNPERLGRFGGYVSRMPNVVNIDHHPSNKRWGTYNWIDERASATAEFIYLLLKELGVKIDNGIATCLYAGIITDTGRFCYDNTTEFTHRVVADLLGCGVSPSEVADRLYAQNKPARIKLLGYVLSTLAYDGDNGLAWVWVRQEMYRKSGAISGETEGFIDYVRDLAGIKVAVLMEEQDDGKTVRISMRSRDKKVDVNRIAALYGGGGHSAAAGAVIRGESRAVEEKILGEVRNAIKRARA